MKSIIVEKLKSPKSVKELKAIAKDYDYELFFETLKKLEADDILYFDETKKVYMRMPSNFFIAFVEGDKKGRKYFMYNDTKIFINSNDVLVGDKCIFDKSNNYKVVKILDRSKTKFHAKVVIKDGKKNLVGLDDGIFPFVINPKHLKNYSIGDIVSLDIECEKLGEYYNAYVREYLCNEKDPNSDTIRLYDEFDLRYEFSNKTMEELNSIPDEVDEREIVDRVDLRDECIFTVDCEEAKDLDDAISIKKTDYGYKVKVSIADVPYYVPINSGMFKDAIANCFSIYTPGCVNPMLPHKLSSGICSLSEGVDRLTRTTEIDYDHEGNIIDHKFYKSVINSKKKMTYDCVNALWNDEEVPGYESFKEDLSSLKELSELICKRRDSNGYLEFNSHEVKFLMDQDKNTYDVVINDSKDSGKMIENLMVDTNYLYAQDYCNLGIPVRNHQGPDLDDIKRALIKLKNMDISVFNPTSTDNRLVQKLIRSLDGGDVSLVTHLIVLKSMKRAYYSTEMVGHYGLGLDYYAHTTSPIRRITDYLVFYTLDFYNKENLSDLDIKTYCEFLDSACKVASAKEKIIDNLEKESNKLEMCKFLEDKIGMEMEVTISDVYPHGVAVIHPLYLGGFIKFDDMHEGPLKYNEKKGSLTGKLSGWSYKVGHSLLVKLSSVNMDSRSINFELVENLSKSMDSNDRNKNKELEEDKEKVLQRVI